LLHVPLLIAGPGIPSGRRIPDVVSLQQLFATVLDLSQGSAAVPERASLRCYWTSPAQECDPSPLVVSELSDHLNSAEIGNSISALTPDWHFISDPAGDRELYRLTSDPREEVNLADSPDHRVDVEILERRLVLQLQASARPWRRESYLEGLGEKNFALVTGNTLTPLGGTRGTARRRPPPPDRELLHSIPYQ
jgi:arylsulfatase A-like enzyme